ncbi:hypothetical protein ABIE62_000902 [Porphyrobacter sp. MBR-155]|uniref:hypothetical protein n=1 Tax=Porphyrobacter sp. MBR-155 TaxID=3156464 RepID=UPI0033917E7E
MSEPTRTARLRELRGQVVARLAKDVAGYRAAARNLALRRASGADAPPFTVADGVHVAMSLKHSHLANDFAHLHVLDELLSRQLDLFGGRL